MREARAGSRVPGTGPGRGACLHAARGRLGVALALTCFGCAHAPPHAAGARVAPGVTPDSITTALWHMDETGGTHVADAGRFRLDGRAGLDTRTDFGRLRGARLF